MDLTKQLSQREQEISKQEQLLESMAKFDRERISIKKQLESLLDQSESTEETYSKKTSAFNRYFTNYAERINGERPVLTYVPNVSQFPLHITDLTGTSTGTRKSLIAAYDLAYQRFAVDDDKQVPHFVVHDVLESIEGPSLVATTEIVHESGVQYIVAILKEKLDSSGFTEKQQDDYGLVKLSSNSRLFDDPRTNSHTI